MTQYALVKSVGGEILTFPYTYRALREANPKISFPRDPDAARLQDFNIFEVVSIKQPAYDLTKNIVEGVPIWIGETLQQTWTQDNATVEKIAERQKKEKDEADQLSIKANATIQSFIAMSPAQVKQYVANNSGTVSERVALIETLALMVLMMARREFR